MATVWSPVEGHSFTSWLNNGTPLGHDWEMSYGSYDDQVLRFIYGCPMWGCNAVDPNRR